MSHSEAVKAALIASPALLWDVSGARQEQGVPPTFSVRAVRSWILSAWERYVNPLQVVKDAMIVLLQNAWNTFTVVALIERL